jgi:hypothetical protein
VTGLARRGNRKIFLFLAAQTLSAAQFDSTVENGFILGGPGEVQRPNWIKLPKIA